jgi:hypothetical protein
MGGKPVGGSIKVQAAGRNVGKASLTALFLLWALAGGYQSPASQGKQPAARDENPAGTTPRGDAASTVGIPWKGGPGVTETVVAIMEREARRIPQGPIPIRETKEAPPRDPFYLLNPPAPAVSQWPPADPLSLLSPDGGVQLDSTIVPLNPQTPGTSFKGVTVSESGFIPPDSMGDIGPTQILFAENGRVKVFDRNGVLGALNVTDSTFFASVLAVNEEVTDPQVRYDRLSQRWFVTMLSLPATAIANKILIAVSSGPTITDTTSFTFFQFTFDQVGTTPNPDTGLFADYDSLGVDRFALYVGVDVFNQAGTTLMGTTGFVIRKSDLLSGTLTVTAFRQLATGAVAGPYAPRGVSNDDPAATEGYFIGVDILAFSTLQIRRVTDPGGTPSISGNLTLSVSLTQFPVRQVVKGSNSNRRLDALDDRLFDAVVHRNKITGATTLWAAHNIGVNSSCVATATTPRNGSRWYEIQNLTATPTLRQSGTLCDSAATGPRGFWIPSLAASGQGHMAMGTSYASTNDFAGIASAGRLRTDTLGVTQSPTLALVSSTAYNVQAVDGQRWGDYSHTVVDPNDDQTFWTFQEYCDLNNSWGVQAIQLKAPLPANPSAASPATACQNLPSLDVAVTGTSSAGTEFFDPGPDAGGPGYLNRIAASVTGGVTVSSVTFTDPTHVTLHLSTIGASPGAQNITLTNPDGQSATGNNLLTITAGPSSPTASNDGPICAGQTLHLSASTVAGATYAWTGPNGFTSSVQNPSIPGATAAASGDYNVTVTVGGCASLPAITSAVVSGDGGACEDGNPCTAGDTCLSGTCISGPLPDADGDGFTDSACGGNDCNDADGSVWSFPAEASNLMVLSEDPSNLSWDSQAIAAGPGTLYDLVSGSLLYPVSGVAFSPAACLQNSSATTSSDGRPVPDLETGIWYLVRGRNSCGTGSYGSTQRDSGIPACP